MLTRCNLVSATVLLHKPYLLYSTENHHVSNSRRSLAMDAINTVSWEFFHESEKMLDEDRLSFYATSPLILHWGYESLIHLRALTRIEPEEEETFWGLATVQKALQKVSSRWKAAGMTKSFSSN